MRVALDAQLTVGTATGIGEYVRGLIAALRDTSVDAVALRAPWLDPWRFDRRVLWDQVLLPLRSSASGADLLHCASGTVPFAARAPFVVTVHDVAWLAAQQHARPYARWYFGKFALRNYRRAARIVVDSNFSREELLPLLPGYDPARVHVVYPGVADDFIALNRRTGDGHTILAVGTVERRKNLEVVIRALARLDGARLVAVGPRTPYADECRALARELNLADRVELPGYVSRDALLELYRNAAVSVVPSRYEGFGYAAAQALCAGVPCIVSNESSLPEVVGSDARIAGADDVDAWQEALNTALRGYDDDHAARLRASAIARFSWAASARAMESIYSAALTSS